MFALLFFLLSVVPHPNSLISLAGAVAFAHFQMLEKNILSKKSFWHFSRIVFIAEVFEPPTIVLFARSRTRHPSADYNTLLVVPQNGVISNEWGDLERVGCLGTSGVTWNEWGDLERVG